MLLATETAVHAAFIIAEPHLTFNWPLKHIGEMELHREGVEVSIDPTLVTPICLPVNHTPVHFTKEPTPMRVFTVTCTAALVFRALVDLHALLNCMFWSVPGTCHY